MTTLLPTKHILLIAAISGVLALIILALPESEPETNNVISFDASLEIVNQSELTLEDIPKFTPNTRSAVDTLPSATQTHAVPKTPKPIASQPTSPPNSTYELPTPEALIKKSSPPTFKQLTATVAPGDSLSRLLSKQGVSAQDIYKVSLADEKQKTLLQMKPGQTLNFKINEISGELVELTLKLNRLESVNFKRVDQKFNRNDVVRTPEIVQTYKEAEINNSLFVDGLRADIKQSLLIELANIFGWDIDFALDIRKGDALSVLYEEHFLDGERIGHGNIIATQFINNGRVFQAVRYETQKGANYYTPDGLSMRKAFIRTPVDFTRISSKFNPNRLHPIFKTSRPHRGVDYAAATGTPVKAAGDGKVTFAGKQKGYGNVVIIDHGRGYETLYAHLNGFARGTKRGARVQQGRTIAYVGQTGWATGPHLHYEFRINGTHKNPVTVKLPNDAPMPKSDLKKYLPYAKGIVATLENSQSPTLSQKLDSLKK